MLNRKLNRAGSALLFIFFAVLRAKAGFSPVYLDASIFSSVISHGINVNTNDTGLTISPAKNSLSTPEIPLHPSMKSFIADYNDDNDILFEKLKLNKSGYFKTIDKIFTQYEIPVELKYLAVVESKLKTNAVSGCGAMGLWQFMPATAKRFGLKISSKYDERQHLWKSSVAAAKYLNYLYDFLGDWLLVVAAYNSGPAPVLNAIKKSGSKNFWQLQYFLPKETRLHVKKFIATHYYFEGEGSMVTIGKAESEKYLKELEIYNSENNDNNEEDNSTDPSEQSTANAPWVAVLADEENVKFVLKK